MVSDAAGDGSETVPAAQAAEKVVPSTTAESEVNNTVSNVGSGLDSRERRLTRQTNRQSISGDAQAGTSGREMAPNTGF